MSDESISKDAIAATIRDLSGAKDLVQRLIDDAKMTPQEISEGMDNRVSSRTIYRWARASPGTRATIRRWRRLSPLGVADG